MKAGASAPPVSSLLYNWDFTQSLTDTIGGVTATMYSAATEWDANGAYIEDEQRYLRLPGVYNVGRTYWVTFTDFNTRKGGTAGKHGRIIMASDGANTSNNGCGFVYRSTGTITFYTSSSWNTEAIPSTGKFDYFANSTLKMYVDADGMASVYKNNELVISATKAIKSSRIGKDIVLGGSTNDCAAYMCVTAIQIYDGFVI